MTIKTATAQTGVKGTIWDVPGIDETPAFKTMAVDSAIGIIYQGLPYKQHAQSVFAYYATPGTISGNRSLDKHLPAVVLVHGGGGTAFREWALMWAKKGYAAIAMDLRGNGPERKHLENGLEETNGQTPYFDVTPDLHDQWLYQAVANVLLAHNLIRQFPEIDSNRIAITGISWGGVITCMMAGLDNRYKAAVPVYGCGYLWECGNMAKAVAGISLQNQETWIKQYDPSNYIGKAGMPVLFINGANDVHFWLTAYAHTYALVRNRYLCIKVGMKHSHHYGWANDEIFTFINHLFNNTPPLPVIKDFRITNGQVTASISNASDSVQSFLNYTTDTTSLPEKRKWESIRVSVKSNKINCPVAPAGAVVWYLSLLDGNGLQSSGPLQFLN
ncbi:acetyl xylan esterase AXE1 [Chitinophaga niastensis]|uniref:Acetyl xylan esterase AXE1 n=1 Tax=Chitinophaga niastensis TaxID=536980 RepID=A0A2P8HCF3_CHINA|nr:acetyl xylan esterase AXE1 [Chitinophaga niastensis]